MHLRINLNSMEIILLNCSLTVVNPLDDILSKLNVKKSLGYLKFDMNKSSD